MALTAAEEQRLAELETLRSGGVQPNSGMQASGDIQYDEDWTPEDQQRFDELEKTRGADDNGKMIDEAHPALSGMKGFKTRFVYKNLSADPEAGFNYLQKQYPDMNFKKHGDEVLLKRPEETQWRKLDPSGFDLEDITDVGSDIVSGVAETVAGIGGGVLGGLGGTAVAPGVGTVAGGLAGASAASGATAAGVEALRQKFGQAAGIDQQFDPGQVKTAAMFGAGAPLLFGTGAAGKHVAKAGAKGLGKYFTEKAGEKLAARGIEAPLAEVVAKGQRGALSAGFSKAKDAVFPNVGQFVSGVQADTIRYASRHLDDIVKAEESGYGRAQIYGQLKDTIEAKHVDDIRSIGDELGKAMKDMDISVDLDAVHAPFDDLLDQYAQRASSYVDELVEQYGEEEGVKLAMRTDVVKNYTKLNKILEAKKSPFSVLDGPGAVAYKKDLNELTNISKPAGVSLSPLEKDLQRTSRQAVAKLDSTFNTGELKAINEKYSHAIDRGDLLKKFFKDEFSTQRTLHSLLGKKKGAERLALEKIDRELGTDVLGEAKHQIAIDLFSRPSMDAIGSGGTTSTSHSVPLGGLGGFLGYAAGNKIGPESGGRVLGAGVGAYLGSKIGSPAALRTVMKANKAAGTPWRAMQKTGLPQPALRTWKNIQLNEDY